MTTDHPADGAGFTNPDASGDEAQFLSYFAKHHQRIFAYIFSQLPNRADAEDVRFRKSCASHRVSKACCFSLGLLFVNHLSLLAATERADLPPNIVLLLADDLGWADVGFHGSQIRTPSLDAMAADGVRLQSFYVQPTCTPTRIALMTGRYPYRVGGHVCVLRPHHTHGLPTDLQLLSGALRSAGYATAITGKWHLGLARKAFWPGARGFDLCYGHLGGAIDHFTHRGYGALDWYDNDHIPLNESGYSTDLIGARAVKIINEHDFSSQALFLYVSFNAPHTPIQAKPQDLTAYQGVFQDRTRRTYAAMVTALDRQIGTIREALQQRGVAERTLIMFASDNGGHNDGASNKPLRGTKGTLYEGGIRVPAVACWPSQLTAGTTMNQVTHIVDLFPTFVALAGGSLASDKPSDGIDVWPALKHGTPLPRRDVVHNVRRGKRGAIRSGKWKLIVTPAGKAERGGLPLPGTENVAELFNIEEDPYEQWNQAAREPDRVQELLAKLTQYGREEVSPAAYCRPATADWKAPKDWANVPD